MSEIISVRTTGSPVFCMSTVAAIPLQCTLFHCTNLRELTEELFRRTFAPKEFTHE